jgi:thiamine biosynthesis lipoprotein
MPSSRSKAKLRAPKQAIQPTHHWTFDAIGTKWWIGIYQPLSHAVLSEVQTTIQERIETFDKTYSRFRDDSLVSRIAQKAGRYELPHDSQALFTLYRQLYDSSDGLVTPLIGQVLSDAGYDAVYSLQPGELATPPAWDDVMTYRDSVLITTWPVLLDFGAAGKGYLVDIIAELLQAAGISKFCIDGSGDVRCQGLNTPLTIGLENPHNPNEAIGTAQLYNQAICGSAGNRRAWGNYHHIMNPQSLSAVQEVRAVWAVAETALVADGLATALFFVDPQKLQADFDFACCVVYDDSTARCSPNFPGELFS